MNECSWSIRLLLVALAFVLCSFGADDKLNNILPQIRGSMSEDEMKVFPAKNVANGHVIAFGHSNSNRKYDYILLEGGHDRRKISVWQRKSDIVSKGEIVYEENENPGFSIYAPGGFEIIGATFVDVNHDGLSDVLVVYRSNLAKDSQEITNTELYLGTKTKGFVKSDWKDLEFHGHSFPVDLYGTFSLDIVGVGNDHLMHFSPSLISSDNKESSNEVTSHFGEIKPLFSHSNSKEFPSQPGWHAIADFNSDGRPDFLVTLSENHSNLLSSFEIWTFNSEKARKMTSEDKNRLKETNTPPFNLSAREILPQGAMGPLAVADMDVDGYPDVVFAVCNPPDSCSIEMSIMVLHSRPRDGRAFCRSFGQTSNCIPPTEEQLFFPNSPQDFHFPESTKIDLRALLKEAGLNPMKWKLATWDPVARLPIHISIGDVDLNAHPDILLVLCPNDTSPDSSYDISQYRPMVIRSRSSKLNNSLKREYFFVWPDDTKNELGNTGDTEMIRYHQEYISLLSMRQVVSVSFADWNGQGAPGILVNYYDSDKKTMRAKAFRNTTATYGYFLRCEALNGVCPAPCSAATTRSVAEKPYGVNYPGASFRFRVSDESIRTHYGVQLSQTANRALQSPNAIFGLGTLYTFVDLISVGVAGVSTDSHFQPLGTHTFDYPNVIPNSDLLLSPPHADETDWRIEMIIQPGPHILYIFVTTLLVLVALILFTSVFKYIERREDERARSRHLFNYNAL